MRDVRHDFTVQKISLIRPGVVLLWSVISAVKQKQPEVQTRNPVRKVQAGQVKLLIFRCHFYNLNGMASPLRLILFIYRL